MMGNGNKVFRISEKLKWKDTKVWRTAVGKGWFVIFDFGDMIWSCVRLLDRH